MSKKYISIKYRGRMIRLIGTKYHAYVNSVEQTFDDLESAKRAVDEFLDRVHHVRKSIGTLRTIPYEEAKEKFFTEQQAKGRSETTLRNYRTFFSQLEKAKKLEQTKDIDLEMVSKFIAKFNAQTTKRTIYMMVRRFVGFCKGRNYLIDGEILKLDVKDAKPLNGKRAVTEDELKVCTDWMLKRKTVLKLLWQVGTQVGMRTGEVVALLRKDFNYDDRTIETQARKNDGRRALQITGELADLLKAHMATCESEFLVSNNGKKYTEQAMQSLVKRMRKELNLSKDIAFYSLRKRMSNISYDVGGPALEAKLLGHTSEVALDNYIKVNAEQGRQVLNKSSVIGGVQPVQAITKESVENYLRELVKTEREWVKELFVKLL